MVDRMSRREALGVFAAVATASVTAPNLLRAQTQGNVLRIGTVITPPHPVVVVLEEFKKRVEERTDKAINVQIFHTAQLGGEREMAEGMRLGSIEGAAITLAAVSTWVPQGGLFDLPFVFKDDDHALRVYNGATAKRLAEFYPPQGFRVLGFSLSGVRNLFSTYPVAKPEDVRGRKMRTLQSPLHIAIWKTVGANPTPIPHPEVYGALQTKVVDIADNTATNYVNERWYEVAPNYSTTGHIYAIGATFVSERWFQRQKADHQKALVESMAEVVPMQHKLILAQDAESLGKAERAGAKIIRITDKSAWSDPMRPIWNEWAGQHATHKELFDAMAATS
jgi:tripartite ATP-independent transporter DctP family solute receptor